MNQQKIEQFISSLLFGTNWKITAISGVVLLGALVILQSLLFTILIVVLKVALPLGAIFLIGRALYLAFPTIIRKLKGE